MKYFIRAAVFLVAIMTVQVGAAHAAQYYVDSTYTGSTSNGALATPWKTLSQVQGAALVAGDIVSFKRGTTYSGTLTINRSGAAGNPITFNAYGTGANPQFIGTGASITQLVYMNNRSYIVFDGIDVTDPTMSPTDRSIQSKIERAFYIDGTSNNVTIKNCSISLVGIGAYFVGPNNTMQNCTVENLRMVRNTPTTVNPDDDYGANPLVISSAGNKILNNKFIGCWANSYDYQYDGGGIDFYGDGASNNYVAYNLITDCNGTVEFGSNNAGVLTNNVLAYNLLINNGSTSYVNNSGQYTVNVSGLAFYNNVILETQPFRLPESAMFSFRVTPTLANSLILKNNIIQLYGTVDVTRSGQLSASTFVHENNVYKLGSGSILNFTANPSELTTTAAYWTNTTASDPTTWDFRPIAGSVIVDRGTNVGIANDFAGNAVPQGAAPDAGIYEYTTTVVPDTTLPTVAITAPTSGATLSGTTTISANASDNIAVVGVQFKVDGVAVGTEDTTAPYTISWNTTTATNASHTISAVARDAAGNTATASVPVTVSNTVAPSVPTGLSATATSASSVSLGWTAATGTVTGYKVYRNAVMIAQVAGTSYVDATVTGSTSYSYSVSAYNATTESAQSPAVSVTTPAAATMMQTTARVNVRANPTTWSTGTILGTQAKGAIGTVISGPVTANGYTWWKIDFQTGADGWVVSRYLTEYTGTSTARTSSTDVVGTTNSVTSLQALDLLQQASRATSTSEALRLIEQAKLLVK
jgi:hypothetical protein